MSVNMQTLHDVLVAIVTTVGIALALAIAMTAAGAVYGRDQAHKTELRRSGPAQQPTQTDDASDLVLR